MINHELLEFISNRDHALEPSLSIYIQDEYSSRDLSSRVANMSLNMAGRVLYSRLPFSARESEALLLMIANKSHRFFHLSAPCTHAPWFFFSPFVVGIPTVGQFPSRHFHHTSNTRYFRAMKNTPALQCQLLARYCRLYCQLKRSIW